MNARAVKPPACPTNCSTCSNGTCTKCKSGYYLSGGKCIVETPDSCGTNYYWSETETMPGSGSHCIACGYKYGPCLQCNATQCTKCSNGYLMVNNSCQHYQSACTQLGWTSYVTATSSNGLSSASSSWGSSNNCRSGVQTYMRFQISDSLWGTCVKCAPSSSTSSCGTYPNCNSGCWYGPSKNSCIKCDANASTCSKSTITCKPGYVLMGGYVCASCASGCKACTTAGDPYACTSCTSGRVPKDHNGNYTSKGKCS